MLACWGVLQGVVNRDIKLENTLLDSSPRPLVKICDFGYSKVCWEQEGVGAWCMVQSNKQLHTQLQAAQQLDFLMLHSAVAVGKYRSIV